MSLNSGGSACAPRKVRRDTDVRQFADTGGGAQHFHFGLEIEAVAGFDLQRGDALPRHARGRARGGCGKRVFALFAGGAHGGDDAAAGTGDLFIGLALGTHFPLMGPISGEDEMGVAVDQARRNPGAVETAALTRFA